MKALFNNFYLEITKNPMHLRLFASSSFHPKNKKTAQKFYTDPSADGEVLFLSISKNPSLINTDSF